MTDNRSYAFAFVAEVLKDDPALAARDIVWLTPESPDFFEPLPVGRYGVRLVPRLGRTERQAVGVGGKGYAKCTLSLAVGVRCPGYSFTDAMDFWGEIEAALLPRGNDRPAFDRSARENGISDIQVVQPAAPLDPTETAFGQIDLIVHVPA